MAERLVHVGNVLVDVVLYVPALPERGADVLATRSVVTPGGGVNVLTAAVRQGLPSVYGGMHGTGPFGDLCRAALADVQVVQPVLPDVDTGFTVAMVDGTGERTFATSPGAEAQLDATRLAALDVRSTDILYVSGYGLAYPVNGPALASWLSTVDAMVIVDPGPLVADIPATVLDPVLARADWLSCNEREAALLGTLPPRSVIRGGADGCDVLDGTTTYVPPFPVEAIDTNGAGDTHVGAFAAALARGQDPVTAARRANAAAALSVTRRGPATAPTSAEVDELLAEHG
ncbi:MAG TPA: PfkB family carbohydrate kinase [Pseudonocardiaceae bacterium]|nr:PfkB family carbohydrate kinase [Pseudonocardiaceae bacterium]